MLRQRYNSPFVPNARPQKTRLRAIDPMAFLASLIGAPVLVAVLGFWALFIPVFAVFIGGPLYVIVGFPILIWHLSHHPARAMSIAWLAFKANLLLVIVGLGYLHVTQGTHIFEEYAIWAAFSLPMAPLWGAAFGLLYPKLERRFYCTLNV